MPVVIKQGVRIMSYISNPASPDRSRKWLRFIFPALVIVLSGGVFAFAIIGTRLHLDTDETMGMYFAMLWLSLPIGILLLGVWWVFFSGIRWRYRFGVLVLLLPIGPALWFSTVRSVELTTVGGLMLPVLHFAWEPTTLQQFDDYQKQAKSDGLPPVNLTIGPDDFPRFRGVKADGIIAHLKLQTDWAKYPPQELWRHPVVGGYSGVAVAGNVVVTMEQRGHQEVVVCYDRATGRQRWNFAYDAYHKDVMGDGPRSTPTIHDGLIFTLGATGYLMCFDGEGKQKWATNILRDCRAKNIQWGLTGSPLIVNDLVVAHAGIDPDNRFDAALVAYEYKTGVKRWARGNRRAGYSSPQLAKLGGMWQILLFDGEALAGIDPLDGRELWMFPWATDMQQNMSQPVVIGDDRVFISSEVKNGCALLRVTAPRKDAKDWSVTPVWRKEKKLAARFSNPVTDGTHIFGLHNVRGFLMCLDAKDGSVKWEGEEYGPGQMLLVDDVLLIVSDQGEVSLVQTDSAAANVLARYRAFAGKTWNTPAIAGDHLFIRNQFEIACFKLPRR